MVGFSLHLCVFLLLLFFFKQKTAYEMRISDLSLDVFSSDLFCNRARYSIGVGVTGFELDFWGRVRNLSDAARSQYLATVQAERAFRLALIRDVASTYFASREADERIALAEATVRSRQEGLRI